MNAKESLGYSLLCSRGGGREGRLVQCSAGCISPMLSCQPSSAVPVLYCNFMLEARAAEPSSPAVHGLQAGRPPCSRHQPALMAITVILSHNGPAYWPFCVNTNVQHGLHSNSKREREREFVQFCIVKDLWCTSACQEAVMTTIILLNILVVAGLPPSTHQHHHVDWDLYCQGTIRPSGSQFLVKYAFNGGNSSALHCQQWWWVAMGEKVSGKPRSLSVQWK